SRSIPASIRPSGAPMAIAAGCDTLTSSMFGLLDRVNPNTVDAVQVFDKNRKGVLMGDGGVALILETEEHALANGRTPLAWLRGVGLSTDAVHETAPDKDGILGALSDGYSRAGITPDAVDVIYVHGTGTALNDGTEASVLATAFEHVADKPALSGIKAMTGHTSGASGAIGIVAGIKSLQSGQVPPTPGTADRVDEAAGFKLSDTAQSQPIGTVQVNAFGFGGVNSVVLLSKYAEAQNGL
ncbi:MAG: 3-oxoacyl-ACP synthase, partial [Pseudomonadota bacterium]